MALPPRNTSPKSQVLFLVTCTGGRPQVSQYVWLPGRIIRWLGGGCLHRWAVAMPVDMGLAYLRNLIYTRLYSHTEHSEVMLHSMWSDREPQELATPY